VGELGYPAESVEIPPRLDALNRTGTAVAFVAEVDSRVIGLVTAHVWSGIHATRPVGWLTSLVVSGDSYKQGVGKTLVAAAEEWLRARGAERMNLTSALRRKEAHEFYKHIGFTHTGVRLTKELK
jgi:GNAT superfamily N-acetyltransferase